VTLSVLEIVLGIDNVVFISVLVGRLDPARQRRARQIGLTLALAFRIALLFMLTHLAAHPHCVLTHRQLLQSVWGPGHAHDTHYLRVYMGQLRKKIEHDRAQPRHLVTETGIGYRFVP
jgi:predicted tellurium resistance membrane protein TerC